mmetsp:Transcript_45737/g.75471  ORF Transcript_45737/g.75471 Transcript_45737/m.75471 type:complete len:164 (-) Transcript_45737:186-677(-)
MGGGVRAGAGARSGRGPRGRQSRCSPRLCGQRAGGLPPGRNGDGGGGGSDHELVWLPGHTWGSTGMLYTPPGQPEERILFTGDHLAFSGRTGELTAFLRYNRGGQDQQLESLEKLKGLDFRWILPGHGRKYRFRDTESRNMLLDICIKRSTSGRGVDFVEVAS